jgi:hypothetical protein
MLSVQLMAMGCKAEMHQVMNGGRRGGGFGGAVAASGASQSTAGALAMASTSKFRVAT